MKKYCLENTQVSTDGWTQRMQELQRSREDNRQIGEVKGVSEEVKAMNVTTCSTNSKRRKKRWDIDKSTEELFVLPEGGPSEGPYADQRWYGVIRGIKKEMTQMNLQTKQKQPQTWRMNLQLPGEGWGKGIVREFGMIMCTRLYLKEITNKDRLYSTWNSAQCYVPAWMGGELGGE